MPVLFISHSYRDDAAVTGLESWLRSHGFTDLFVDHKNLAAGDKWAQALREASGACRVVICVVTKDWLASDECFGEFRAAWYMGRRIVPLLALGPGEGAGERLNKVLAESQGLNILGCLSAAGELDLSHDPEVERSLVTGLREAGALAEIGLDPEAFAIDRDLRPTPFPGLESFGDDDADAALFFGRSREIAETLEELRQARALRDLRPLVVLGASGAGKSSLLKAGIIPRLRREVPAWLPLRAFRPGADPLFNFAEALARTFGDFGKVEAPGGIRDRLLQAWSAAERDSGTLTAAGGRALDAALNVEARKLWAAANRSGATILISVDQAEEITRAEGTSGDALADYLRTASAAPDYWQLVFTIRTDSFPELQTHARFQNLNARGYDLRALPVFRFDSIVEAPAKRYGVIVDHALVDALIENAPNEDALPLLAFALQRLWRQHAASKALTRGNYDSVGGLKGLIEDAAERALRGVGPKDEVLLPSGPPPKSLSDLAASAFVPSLVQVNERGGMIRRIAEWRNFTSEQQHLLARFDQWRLVVRKGAAEGGTVEVAHEALFREWARLRSWLEPERARLEALRLLQVDAVTWDQNGRSPIFLSHRGQRLSEAAALNDIEAYRKRLTPPDLEYLASCQAVEKSARIRVRYVRALISVLLVGIIGGLVGWINQSSIKELWRWYSVERPFGVANIQGYVLSAEAERRLRPLDVFRECAVAEAKDFCPEMVVVPAGSFTMGSPGDAQVSTAAVNAPGSYRRSDGSDERPPHPVTIKAFTVSKFPVTFDQWDICAAFGNCAPDVPDANFGRGQRPAINVSWDDAQRYVAWLSKMTGKNYRLLTESEYEYAARAGSQSASPWGPEVGTNNAVCNGCGSKWDNEHSAPVGSLAANGFGLHDMVGNVFQWVEDCYYPDYTGAPADGSARISNDPRECPRRVDRGGGSWHDPPEAVRSAGRDKGTSDRRGYDLGFRVARTLGP